MKLYRSKIPAAAHDILRRLIEDRDIEVTNQDEAEQDVQSVLNEFIRLERQVTEEAKDILDARKLPREQYGRVRRILAGNKGVGLGDESLIWMCAQILETFMQSSFVAEIYASDVEMRRKMQDILRQHMMVDDELDEEVRGRIKNLREGTANWEVEYARVMEDIKRQRGLKGD